MKKGRLKSFSSSYIMHNAKSPMLWWICTGFVCVCRIREKENLSEAWPDVLVEGECFNLVKNSGDEKLSQLSGKFSLTHWILHNISVIHSFPNAYLAALSCTILNAFGTITQDCIHYFSITTPERQFRCIFT